MMTTVVVVVDAAVILAVEEDAVQTLADSCTGSDDDDDDLHDACCSTHSVFVAMWEGVEVIEGVQLAAAIKNSVQLHSDVSTGMAAFEPHHADVDLTT